MSDKKHLKLRGNIWWFVRRVPSKLKHMYPDTNWIQQSLNTSDIRIARTKRDILMGKMQEQQLSAMVSDKARFEQLVVEMTNAKKQAHKNHHQWLDSLSPIDRRAALETYGDDGLFEQVWEPDYVGRTEDKAYTEAYNAVLSGRDHSPEFGISLLEAVRDYAKYHENKKTHGTLTKMKHSAGLLLSFLGKKDLQLTQLERRQIFDWLRHLEANYKGNTVFTHLSRMRSLYKWIASRGDIPADNPFVGQQVQTSAQHQQYQLFTQDELQQIDAAMNEQPLELRTLYEIGLHTGARLSEIGTLTLNQIKLDDDCPHLLIKTGKQKTGSIPKFRLVPLADRPLAFVQRLYAEAFSSGSEFLFHKSVSVRTDGRIAQGLGVKFGKVKKQFASESNKAFHSLRVHAATWFQAANVPEHIASTLLGHTNGQTMSYAYYAKQNPDLKPYSEAIESLALSVEKTLLG